MIKKGAKVGHIHRRQRGWALGVALGLLVLTVVVSFAGPAFVDPAAWERLQPEVKEVRTFVFFTAATLFGFYFARTRGRGE